jgi:two-component system cell cycle response regulator
MARIGGSPRACPCFSRAISRSGTFLAGGKRTVSSDQPNDDKDWEEADTRPDLTVRLPRAALDLKALAVLRAHLPPLAAVREEEPEPEPSGQRRDTPYAYFAPTESQRNRAILTLLVGPNAGAVFSLGERATLGRGTDATIRIDSPSVSRLHARIERDGDSRYVVEDLRSTNGTFVSTRPVLKRTELTSGDRLQLGPFVFRFAVVDETEDELQRRLYEASTRDVLTGLHNRKFFFERLESELLHAQRTGDGLSVIMLDIDHFKSVNDTYGHAVGDHVLRCIASRGKQLVRPGDVIARYGGEEFILLVRAPKKDAVALAERLRAAIAEMRMEVGNGAIGVTASLGIFAASEADPMTAPQALVASADARLYDAKAGGRNRVCSEG